MDREQRIEELKAHLADTARQLFVEVLRRDADLHEQGELAMIGEGFEEIDGSWPRGRNSHQLGLAWNFYDSWIDERNHGFVGHYEAITKDEWPRYARYIADRLEAGQEIADPVLLAEFDYGPRTSFVDAIKGLFGTK